MALARCRARCEALDGDIAASVPALSLADFPLASLLIYTIGMGFVAMPLCLYHELLLEHRMHGA